MWRLKDWSGIFSIIDEIGAELVGLVSLLIEFTVLNLIDWYYVHRPRCILIQLTVVTVVDAYGVHHMMFCLSIKFKWNLIIKNPRWCSWLAPSSAQIGPGQRGHEFESARSKTLSCFLSTKNSFFCSPELFLMDGFSSFFLFPARRGAWVNRCIVNIQSVI